MRQCVPDILIDSGRSPLWATRTTVETLQQIGQDIENCKLALKLTDMPVT